MQHAGDRVGELDADALVVGAPVVERVFQVLPDLGADLGRARHRRLALRGGDAHQLGVLGVHLGRGAGARGGDVPDAEERAKQQRARRAPRAG